MKRKLSLTILILLSLFTLSACQSKGVEKQRYFNLTYTAKVFEIPKNSKELKLWIPLPSSDDVQDVKSLTVTSQPQVDWKITKEKNWGNRMVFVHADNPPKKLTMTINMNVLRKENTSSSHSDPDLKKSLTLESSRLVPINIETLKQANQTVKNAKSDEEKGRAIVLQTLDHMSYDKTGKGWGRGDFKYACEVGKGNCTDFHSYFIGLCRSSGIPAYFEIGLPLKPKEISTSGKTGTYHCWAYYKVNGKWIPVDISEADKRVKTDKEGSEYFLSNHCEDRVAFSKGRDIILAPAQKGGPLNFFIFPYAEIDGKKYDKVEKTSTFKDLK